MEFLLQSTMQSIVDHSASMVAINTTGMTYEWQDMSGMEWRKQAELSAYVPIQASNNLWVVPEHSDIPAAWCAMAPVVMRLLHTWDSGANFDSERWLQHVLALLQAMPLLRTPNNREAPC